MVIGVAFLAVAIGAAGVSSEISDAKGGVFGEAAERQFGLWRPINDGLEGGFVATLAFDPDDPDVALAGTPLGVFRSTDGGLTWSASRPGLPQQSTISELRYHPTVPGRVFAATGSNGVFRSDDNGRTWFPINTGMEFISALALAVDPTDGDRLIAGTSFAFVYLTADGGQNWQPFEVTAGGGTVTSLAIDPTDPDTVYAGLITFSGVGEGAFKSTDGGMTWQPASNGLDVGGPPLGVASLALDSNNPNTLYAGGFCEGIFKTTDGAQNWTQVDNTGCGDAVVIDPADSDRIISTDAISLDGGQNWTETRPNFRPGEVSPEFDDGGISYAFRPGSNEILAGGNSWGIYRSADNGMTWIRSQTGLDAGIPSDIAALSRDLLIVPVDEIGVFRSTDGGSTFSATDSPADLDFNRLEFAPSDPAIGYVGTQDRGVFRTADGGLSWQSVSTGIEFESVEDLAIDVADPDHLYIATDTFPLGRVFFTIDGGQSWAPGGLNLGANGQVFSLAVDPSDGNRVYAGVSDPNGAHRQAVFRSDNGGVTWQLTDTSLDAGGDGVAALVIDPRDPSVLYAGTTGDGVFKTTDGGQTWIQIAPFATNDTIFDLALDPSNPNRLFAGNGTLSTDSGATFRFVGPNFPFGFNVAFNAGDGLTVYNMSSVGLFERRLDESQIDVEFEAAAPGDRFGRRVIINRGLTFVGAPGEGDGGAVFVFRREGERTIQVERIGVPDGFSASEFGAALAVEGDTMVIGAPGAGNGKGNALQAAIFQRAQQGWTFAKQITPSAGQPGDGFGTSVALSGSTIVVGAPGDDSAASGAGAAYVFGFDGDNVTEMARMTGASGEAGFGAAVAAAGNKIAVGAPGSQIGGALTGSVSIFQTVAGNLMPFAELSGDADDDEFGTAVALGPNRLAVGAPGMDMAQADVGAVVLYNLGPQNATRTLTVTADIQDPGSGFGSAVAMDGSALAVGAPTARTVGGQFGAAFLFDTAAGAVQRDRLTSSRANTATFGGAVALDGLALIVGAPESDDGAGRALLVIDNDLLFVGDFE